MKKWNTAGRLQGMASQKEVGMHLEVLQSNSCPVQDLVVHLINDNQLRLENNIFRQSKRKQLEAAFPARSGYAESNVIYS